MSSSAKVSSWSNRLGKRQSRKRRQHSQFRNESTFICGTVKKPLGSNVAVAEKSRVIKRISKKDSALHRHMTWLKELEENKKRLEEEKKAEEERKAERMKLLKRDATGAKKQDNLPGRKDDTGTDNVNAVSKPKPAWCQTEEANKSEELAANNNDEQALLDFVQDLDFEQYTEDLELQTLMSQVKSRIKSLQKEKKKDETRLQACVDSEKAAERAEIVNTEVLVDCVPSDTVADEPEIDDKSIANSVMSTDSTIKTIHSRKSMAALVTDAKRRMITELNPIEEIAMTPPICVTHKDDDGARMAEKKSVNKLAFTRRNPAL